MTLLSQGDAPKTQCFSLYTETMMFLGCPYDLELREVRQESLVLLWAEPVYQGQSQITGYVVEISEGEESEDWTAVTQEPISDMYLKVSIYEGSSKIFHSFLKRKKKKKIFQKNLEFRALYKNKDFKYIHSIF